MQPHLFIVSDFHVRTELNQLTGVAAILTFPLDIEVVEREEKEDQLGQGDSPEDDGG